VTTLTAAHVQPPKATYNAVDGLVDEDSLADDFDDDDDGEEAHKDRYMTFRIGEQDYGIGILDVNEIVSLQSITEVPDVPAYVKGMINLRGNVIPVVDVRLRFGMDPRDYDARTCVVVITVAGVTVGLVVDHVNEVGLFPAESISPPPSGGPRQATGDFVTGLGRRGETVTLLLDAARLVIEAAE
jgi:purine-binding chemotaxis protein CheW